MELGRTDLFRDRPNNFTMYILLKYFLKELLKTSRLEIYNNRCARQCNSHLLTRT